MAFRLILSILLFSSVAFAADNKKEGGELSIAVVDIKKALALSEAGKEAQKKYQKEVKERQEKLDEKKDEYDKFKSSLENQHKSLSSSALREKAAKLDKMDKEVTRLYQDSQEDLRRKNTEIVADLLKDLRKVVFTYGKDNDYKIILDRNSEGLLFADKTIDITEQIIERFNKVRK